MNAYIDLGAFRGLYINRFIKSKFYKPETKIYAFECNPYLKQFNYGKDVVTIRKAAWIYDGLLDFYLAERNPGLTQGSSVYKDKKTGNLNKNKPVRIECMDFSKWLKSFSSESAIFLKCNIEGAEYDVLEKCIKDETISLIKHAWIQWHYHKCAIPKDRHDKLLYELKKYPVVLHHGYGDLK